MIEKIVKKILGPNGLFGSQNEARRLKWLEATLLRIPAKTRILDAGAGQLAQKKYCSHLNYVSQDFGGYDGKGDQNGLQTEKWDNSKLDIICDITDIPEPNGSFGAIMCVEVLEHLPEPILAIKEFSRLLQDNGFLVLTAPFCSLTHFAPFHFHTGFNRYFYEKHLTENDFDILEITPNGNFFEFIAQELTRIPDCAKKYSNKKLSLIGKFLILLTILMLSKLSKKEKNSSELLNFGFHVVAKKRDTKKMEQV